MKVSNEALRFLKPITEKDNTLKNNHGCLLVGGESAINKGKQKTMPLALYKKK